MEDVLAGIAIAIDHQAVNPSIASQLSGNQEHFAQHVPVFILQLVERSDVLARNEQEMCGGLRINITKSEESLILIHLGGGNIPITNFAKYAIVQLSHPFLSSPAPQIGRFFLYKPLRSPHSDNLEPGAPINLWFTPLCYVLYYIVRIKKKSKRLSGQTY
jgi:hypothetical protein